MKQNQVQERINLPEFRGDPGRYAQDLGRELQRQWRNMALVVNNITLPYYEQSTEPTLATNSMALWQDTSDYQRYLVINFAGLQGKTKFTVSGTQSLGGSLTMSGSVSAVKT